MSRHDPVVPLRHMLDYARVAVDMAAPRTREDLDRERMFALALPQCVRVIGATAGDTDPDMQARHPEIPWDEMVRMSNHLLEHYDVIDFDALWDTVTTDLPPLIQQLERIIAAEEAD